MNLEKNLINTLKKKNLTLSIAESITGGLVSYLLTKTPGASSVFKAGVIAYSLEAKSELFRLSLKTLKKCDGVSKKTAEDLAREVRKKFHTDIGASIVGFAGPEKPKNEKKGTIFIAMSFKEKTISQKTLINGSRDIVRKRSSFMLIDLIYKNLK